MIPENAKLVYDGQIFKVYEWEQKLFDGSSETFEAVRRRGTVQLIVVNEGSIILLEEESPMGEKFISMPGGMIDWGENTKESAEREMLEETGMKGNLEEYMERVYEGKLHWDNHYFLCKDAEKVSEPEPDPGEKFYLIRLSFDDFIEKAMSEEFRNKDFQEHIRLLKAEGKLEDLKRRLGLDC